MLSSQANRSEESADFDPLQRLEEDLGASHIRLIVEEVEDVRKTANSAHLCSSLPFCLGKEQHISSLFFSYSTITVFGRLR